MTTNAHESTLRVARYQQHILDLAAAFDVEIFWIDPKRPDRAAAGHIVGTQRKCVAITKVIDESTYAVDLHELGHCLSAFGMLAEQCSVQMRKTNNWSTIRDVRLTIESERAAWEWAHHYALEWTETMTFVERYALSEYERQARRIIGKDFK